MNFGCLVRGILQSRIFRVLIRLKTLVLLYRHRNHYGYVALWLSLSTTKMQTREDHTRSLKESQLHGQRKGLHGMCVG